jgi:NAD-dependent SIR2 family protein deacetylase/Sec-independent protein translocase protein TatA
MSTSGDAFVFLLGAGASKPVGVPITKEFRKEFEKHCSDNDKLAAILGSLLKHDKKQDIEEMLVNLYSLSRLKGSIASKVFEGEVPVLLDAYFGKAKAQGTRRVVSKVRRDLGKWGAEYRELELALLDFINEKCLDFDPTKAHDLYSGLLKECLAPGARVFTTNYDPVLEEVCRKDSVLQDKYADGFVYNRAEGMHVWDFEMRQFNAAPLQVYKLHGSVTWYRDEKAERIIQVPIKLGEGAKFKGGRKMYHLLIYPASIKDIYSYPFFDLYLGFLRALEATSLLIAIGHSFRDDYIRSAVENKMKDADFSLVVVNPLPKEESSELARMLQSSGNVILCPHKLENFRDRLVRFVQEYKRDAKGALSSLKDEMERDIQAERKRRATQSERTRKLQEQQAPAQQPAQPTQ